mmetsp:Transcript_20003/g.60441  ORF Transcript_20003/g.60441 Transcript_20003/m.60441 type:complete len:233 (+) Transcript_20003:679-1377(+)
MLSSMSPWESTSTAMSTKIWCSPCRLYSSCCTVSWRSLISSTVATTCWPWPFCMAVWKMFSDSPESMTRSRYPDSASRPVAANTRRRTVSLCSCFSRASRAWKSPMMSDSVVRSPAVVPVLVRSLLLPTPHPSCCSAVWLSFSRFSSSIFTLSASLLAWCTLACILFLTSRISATRTAILPSSLYCCSCLWMARMPASRSLMVVTCAKNPDSIVSLESACAVISTTTSSLLR